MLAIVILNYNNSKDTIECLESLSIQSYKNFHVFLGDNSTDIKEYDKVKKFLSEKREIGEFTRLIRIDENKGFGSGNNKIIDNIQLDKYSEILLLNNDTVMTDSKLIEKVYNKIQSIGHEKYVIGCKLLNSDESFQESRGDYPGIINELIYSLKLKRFIKKDKFDYLCGAFLFFNIKFIKEVGYFDEDYFLYFEEVDLLYRGEHQGYKLYFLDDVSLIHKGGQSTGKLNEFTVQHYNKSINLFLTKNLKYKFKKYIFFSIRSTVYVLNILLLKGICMLKGKSKYSNRIDWCVKNLKMAKLLIK